MANWSPNAFIERIYEEHLQNAAANRQMTAEKERSQKKARLAELLKIDTQPQSDLHPILLQQEDCGDFIRERVEIQTYKGLTMPIYVLLPKRASERPRPAVIALHGHGYGSRELVGLSPDDQERQEGEGIHKHFALSLVRRGFVVIVPELLGFGERKLDEDALQDTSIEDRRKSSCYKLSSYLTHLGETLAGIRTYEVLRVVDYAQSRPDVQTGGVGSMGLSGGAFVGYLAAALDERFRAVVLSGYTNTYKDSHFFTRQHCLCDYIPGIVELGDMPDIVSLIAPRALYLETGKEDPLFPLHGVLAAAEILEARYEALGVKENFEVEIFDGKHEISGAHAYDWLAAKLEHTVD
ncbi:dienelactone hydrolase family protein [Paenibacillus sp. SI8]|uniref:dienelactone hydrolase family protein n=1 Tax=unclassified Paenibacillus TaxID=185978 RepID=UPI003465B239